MSEAWIPGEWYVPEPTDEDWDEVIQDHLQHKRSHHQSQIAIDKYHAIIDDLCARVATLTDDLARVKAERDTLQLTIDAIECKLIAFDDEAGEYAEEDELIYLWMASVNGKGRRFETAVEAFIALRSASNGGPDCTPNPTS
jgi:uncharacterized small protein (DUF1192 family)